MITGASRSSPRPELRASNAERERVAAFLRDQSLEGRLTTDELDERLGLAYRAVTVSELGGLVADLPGSPLRHPPSPRRPPSPGARRSPDLAPLAMAACVVLVAPLLLGVAASAVALGIALVAVLFALAIAFVPVMLIALALVGAARRHARGSWGQPRHW